MYVNDYNQGVVAGGIGMRGFNTEGDIMHVKLLVDGIPANANSGVADLNAVFPLNIDRMELVKGTNDPRYGLFNIAGNLQVFTSQPGRYTKVKVAGGAYGTGDVQAATAFQTGGCHTCIRRVIGRVTAIAPTLTWTGRRFRGSGSTHQPATVGRSESSRERTTSTRRRRGISRRTNWPPTRGSRRPLPRPMEGRSAHVM